MTELSPKRRAQARGEGGSPRAKRVDAPLLSISGMTGTWVRVKDVMRCALRGVNQGGTAEQRSDEPS